MLSSFLNSLVTIISVTSLLIVIYGALTGTISFPGNEIKRFTGDYSTINTEAESHVRNLPTLGVGIPDCFGYFKGSIGTDLE